MLNDWGIHHFHLGIAPHPTRPQFVARTGPVLYAVVSDHELYCLDVLPHGHWSMTRLLDEVHANWPPLLAPYELKGTQQLAFNPTDDEIKRLRRQGVNVLTQRPDGTVHGSAGLGYATDGTSIAVTGRILMWRRECRTAEKVIAQYYAANAAAGLPPALHLEEDNHCLYAVGPHPGGVRLKVVNGTLHPL